MSPALKRLLLIALCLLLLACSGAGPETPAWLSGRWEVAYNPRHDTNDVLFFQPDAKLRIATEDGQSLDGYYQIKGDQLILLVQVGPRNVETLVRISPQQDRLTFSNGAYYMRAGDRMAADDQDSGQE
jgi:hypothetical protein